MEDQPAPIANLPVSETTWLEAIVGFDCMNTPQGQRILQFTLINGHRYCIALSPDTPLMKAVQKAVSPVVIAGADELPRNGHGA